MRWSRLCSSSYRAPVEERVIVTLYKKKEPPGTARGLLVVQQGCYCRLTCSVSPGPLPLPGPLPRMSPVETTLTHSEPLPL
jgi:hypothetical protein